MRTSVVFDDELVAEARRLGKVTIAEVTTSPRDLAVEVPLDADRP
jgi:hypothetical protein